MRLLDTDDDGVPMLDPLNAEFDAAYLRDPRNPRWVAKPTVAYLWARTVTCKQCRATLPLLKTRWLCKKDNKRVLLTMELENPSFVLSMSKDALRGASSSEYRPTCPATAATRRSDGSTTGASGPAPCRAPARPAPVAELS